MLLLLSATPAAAADLPGVVAAALARSPAAAEARARGKEAEAAGREAFWTRWPRLSARKVRTVRSRLASSAPQERQEARWRARAFRSEAGSSRSR